jgi:hypothetical protein
MVLPMNVANLDDHVTKFLSPELIVMDFAIEQRDIAETMSCPEFKSVRSFKKHSDMDKMDVDIARKLDES